MSAADFDAVVVGAGPNGLAAAITLARAGCSVLVLEANSTIGGGARSAELTLPGFVHDLGSAVHPLGAASPFFRTLALERFGLRWLRPDIPLAHPLDHGTAACLYDSLSRTARALGPDAWTYRQLIGPSVRRWEKLVFEFLQPMLHLPRHPFTLAGFGLRAIWPAAALTNTVFSREPARALFAGVAAHSFLPLEAPVSAAFGVVLGMLAHAVGWPIPLGGAQAITDALAGCLRELGGKIETGVRIGQFSEIPSARAILLDLTPWQFVQIAGRQLPAGYRRRLERFRHAPGVFKVDYALDGPVPWTAEECRRAGTLHLGGTLREIALAERQAAAGAVPERPFVLVSQPTLWDRTRAPAGKHTLWAYCHVPYGLTIDMTDALERQIERFAPGFRERILMRHVSGPAALARLNANLIGGDISGGANNLWQLIARPVFGPVPYRTPLRGVYLCSSSTPPGGGVHGMAGYGAAKAALNDVLCHTAATT
ncbi:MAG: NAD(P)/FAD-dependent oxidoreductase [Verrucomicrobia bacterium]|nr:NAD(P)/FAD-dependent oxidoreductase [Verrucomicrobiota bacterium]